MGAPSGLERVLFAGLGSAAIDGWLTAVIRDRLHSDVAEVLFRAGRIDAVYGLRLDDGRQVVLKVHRPPVDRPVVAAVTTALRHLAAHGYPCPGPIDGPLTRDGRVVTVQSLLTRGDAGNARRPELRRAMTASLAEHIAVLRGVPGGAARLAARLGAGPAWTRYRDGPWPEPHDTIFDFAVTPGGWEWLDGYARDAAGELCGYRAAPVIGHGDWYDGNLRFADDRVVAAFDWDLVVEPEEVIVGLSAGGHLLAGAPTPDEVAAFIADYGRAAAFSPEQYRAACAAARWVLAFNARCDLSVLDGEPVPGSALDRLSRDREGYLRSG